FQSALSYHFCAGAISSGSLGLARKWERGKSNKGRMLLVSEVLKSVVSSCIPPLRQGAVIMRSNSQQLTVDRLFREPSIEDVRHMTASPETGPVVLLYGCTECTWTYPPKTPEQTSKKYLLMAQFKFEQHVCSKYAAGS